MSLKLHVASCTDKCYRTLCAAGQSCEQEVWEIPWLPVTLNFGLKSWILLQQVSLRKTICDGSVLHPFCRSVFPPAGIAKNFSDLFQIFIFLAMTLC